MSGGKSKAASAERPISLADLEADPDLAVAAATLPLLQSRYHALKQEIDALTAEQRDVYAEFRTLADTIPAKKIEGVSTRVESMRGTIKAALLLEKVLGMTPEMIEECTEYKDVSYYLIAPPPSEEGD